jgi:hypothetical protein
VALLASLALVLFLNGLAYQDQARFGYTGVSSYLSESPVTRLQSWVFIAQTSLNQLPLGLIPAFAGLAGGAILLAAVALHSRDEKALLFALLFALGAAAAPALAVGSYAQRMSRFWYLPLVAQTLLAGGAAVRLRDAGPVAWTIVAALVGLRLAPYLPPVLGTAMFPLEGLIIGPVWIAVVALSKSRSSGAKGPSPRPLEIATSWPAVLGLVLLIRGLLVAVAWDPMSYLFLGVALPAACGCGVLAYRRAPLTQHAMIVGAVVLLQLFLQTQLAWARRNGEEEIADSTWPVMTGLVCWLLFEKIKWRGARPAWGGVLVMASLAAVFITRANRLGRRWVRLGEEAPRHVEAVFEHFHIPTERAKLLPK